MQTRSETRGLMVVIVLVGPLCMATFTPGQSAPSAAASTTAAQTGPDKSSQPDILSQIANGIRLRRSSASSDANVGALFSLTRDNIAPSGTDSTIYDADFYLTYNPLDPRDGKTKPIDLPFSLLMFAEGHVSSDDEASENQWRFGAGVQHFQDLTSRRPLNLDGLLWQANLELDADRDFETQQLLANLAVTPASETLGIGSRLTVWNPSEGELAAGERAAIEFIWEPAFGFQLGKTIRTEDDSNSDVPDTVVRTYGSVAGRLMFNPSGSLSKLVNRVDLFAQDKVFALLNEEALPTRNLFVTGVDVRFNDNVGVQCAYTIGRAEPTFEKVETIEIGLSVQF